MEDSSSKTWRPWNTHSKQEACSDSLPRPKPASISHVQQFCLVVSAISVYQARRKVLTFFGVFTMESQRRQKPHPNTKIWSSYLQSWYGECRLIRLLPDQKSDKSGAGLVWHACPTSKWRHPQLANSIRAPCLLAICGPWSQSDQACGRIWRRRLLSWGARSHSGPTPWRLFSAAHPASSLISKSS